MAEALAPVRATGKRKTAVAQVRLNFGTGQVNVTLGTDLNRRTTTAADNSGSEPPVVIDAHRRNVRTDLAVFRLGFDAATPAVRQVQHDVPAFVHDDLVPLAWNLAPADLDGLTAGVHVDGATDLGKPDVSILIDDLDLGRRADDLDGSESVLDPQ